MSAIKIAKKAMQNKNSKHLVFGYVRNLAHNLKIKQNSVMIQYLVCLYYHLMDQFYRAHKDMVQISKDKQTATLLVDDFNHAIYLNEWIESTSKEVVTWTYNINKLHDHLYFGLVSKERETQHLDMDFYSHWCKPCYAISSDRRIYKLGVNDRGTGYRSRGIYLHNYPDPKVPNLIIKTGDKVSFVLNLKNASLSCSINDKPNFLLFDNIERSLEIKWKMALNLSDAGDSVSIIGFSAC